MKQAMTKLQMKYVGDEDRTFVPKRNQLYWSHQQGEKETKEILCVLNKIGNAQGAKCEVLYLDELTQERRKEGRLKYSHYMYALIIEYPKTDDKLFTHYIKSRTGALVGFGLTGVGGCNSGACNGGFCD